MSTSRRLDSYYRAPSENRTAIGRLFRDLCNNLFRVPQLDALEVVFGCRWPDVHLDQNVSSESKEISEDKVAALRFRADNRWRRAHTGDHAGVIFT